MLRQADGQELALGPLEHALVTSVLAAAARMRQYTSYQLHLHVKGGSVVAQVLFHVGDVPYTPGAGWTDGGPD